jgi:hypothetical protein
MSEESSITPEQAYNLIVFLDRAVLVKNLPETVVLANIVQTLLDIRGDYTGEKPSG